MRKSIKNSNNDNKKSKQLTYIYIYFNIIYIKHDKIYKKLMHL